MVCPKCGANNIDGSSLCIKCGNNMNEQPIEPINEQSFQYTNNEQPIEKTQYINNGSPIINEQFDQKPSKEPNNNIKKIIIIIGVILAIILVGCIIKKFVSSKLNKTTSVMFNADTLICVKKDNKYGFINTNGKFVIEPKYNSQSQFYGDYAIVTVENEVDGNKKTIYEVIDKKGNVKASAEYSSKIKFYPEENVWIINNQLFDSSLKKISPDNVEIDSLSNGYVIWKNQNAKTAGIMNLSGKITYTYKYTNDYTYVGISASKVSPAIKDKYCIVNIDNKQYGIVNCDTGKVVYDFIDNFIFDQENNIFSIKKYGTFEYISEIYIQNNKIIYEATDKNISLSYRSNGYIEIADSNKDYKNKYSYIDTSNGKIVNSIPNNSGDLQKILNVWEEFTKLTKYKCDTGYGLMSGEKVKIPCEWKSIDYLDLSLYKYLSSMGKNYVVGKNNNKTYLINLKNGKTDIEFNASYITINPASTFISYVDSETQKKVIYNLVTGKTLSIEKTATLNVYSNYFTVRENGKLDYYNTNMKLIYTEQ